MQAVLHQPGKVAGILSSSYAYDVNIRRAHILPPVAVCEQCRRYRPINAILKKLTHLGRGKRCADCRITSHTIEKRLGVKPGDDKVSRYGMARAGTAHAKDRVEMKTCLRCGTVYSDNDNQNDACHFHGDTTGISLFSFFGLDKRFVSLCTLLRIRRKRSCGSMCNNHNAASGRCAASKAHLLYL
jgi:hypothetical protein